MGYSIWVADDPELHDERVVSDPEDYPYFSISIGGMREIREEMRAQEMTEDTDLPYTEEQIEHALRLSRPEPMLMTDEDGPEVWVKWLDFLRAAQGHGGIVLT